MKKWTDLNRHFFKDIYMANKYMKFSVTNHQGNANQNHSDISPHISEVAIIKKTRNNKCQRGSGQRKPLCTADRNANERRYYGKQYGGSSKS